MSNPHGRDLALIRDDGYLEPHRGALEWRIDRYDEARTRVDAFGGLLGPISEGHRYFGFNRTEAGDGDNAGPGVTYREWAPGAHALFLIGDFNGWNRESHLLVRDDWGTWSITLPDSEYAERLTHESLLKVHVIGADGSRLDRIPAYIRRAVQPTPGGEFIGQFWMPPKDYVWANPTPPLPGESHEGLRIYEAHVGMAVEEGRVGTYDEFANNVLPRIAKLGYNAVQLMAIQEHPYYGSFGYHVSSFLRAVVAVRDARAIESGL